MKKYFLFIVATLLFTNTYCQSKKIPPPPPPPPPYLIESKSDTNEVDEKIWTRVEQEAEFPGGDLAWRTFLEKNIDLSKITQKIKFAKGQKFIQEMVILKFIVSSNGSLKNIEAENNVNPLFVKEAIRVMSLAPKWIPAQQNGRTVNAYRRQPITFRIEAE